MLAQWVELCGRPRVQATNRTNMQGLKITEENVLPLQCASEYKADKIVYYEGTSLKQQGILNVWEIIASAWECKIDFVCMSLTLNAWDLRALCYGQQQGTFKNPHTYYRVGHKDPGVVVWSLSVVLLGWDHTWTDSGYQKAPLYADVWSHPMTSTVKRIEPRGNALSYKNHYHVAGIFMRIEMHQ